MVYVLIGLIFGYDDKWLNEMKRKWPSKMLGNQVGGLVEKGPSEMLKDQAKGLVKLMVL